jgi:phosphate starvation-inducible membrane PsiE
MALITTITWFVHKIIKAEQIKELIQSSMIYFLYFEISFIYGSTLKEKKKTILVY